MQVSGFVSAVSTFDYEELAVEYEALRVTAPRRHRVGKRYFVEHISVAGATSSNRAEEHLAARLLADGELVSKGRTIRLIDFQVPLKARRSDTGIGKIDLLGLDHALVAIELKVARPRGGADTPIGAALEALAYAAILEANVDDLASELDERGISLLDPHPEVLVLGNEHYWQRWLRGAAFDGWREALAAFTDEIQKSLGVQIQFSSLIGDANSITSLDDPH
jgi:hypothetical protein